jgi:hypothetical protein
MVYIPYNLNLPSTGAGLESSDPFDVNELLEWLSNWGDGGDDPQPLPKNFDSTINIAFPQVDSERSDPVSPFTTSSLPEFVAVDHAIFSDFIKAYYEWLEKSGNPVYTSRRFLEYIDIDRTLDDFIPYFLSTYAPFLPDTMESGADLKSIIPHMMEFYEKKGTKESLKFFFRMLFNVDIELFYPKLKLVKSSDGRWTERSIIKSNINGISQGSVSDLTGRIISQRNQGSLVAQATVESVRNTLQETGPMFTVEVSDIFGGFIEGVDAIIAGSSGDVSVSVIPTVGSINVSTGGVNYKTGEKLTISGTGPAADFAGFKGEVGSVDTLGTITSVNILDGGVRASSLGGSTYTVVIDTREGTGATLSVVGGAGSRNMPGYYDGEMGRASSDSYLQDNFYYQEFSYVIRTSKGILDYIDLLRKMIHPAGLKPFGRYLLQTTKELTLAQTVVAPVSYENPLIGHYTPYTFGTTQSLRCNAPGTDLYPIGFNGQTGTIADHTGIVSEGGSNQHVCGVTGSLGSTLGGALGQTVGGGLNAVGIYNDGGTGYLNRADFYEQFGVFGCSAPNGGISGPTFSGQTMGWFVYPHPCHRGIDNLFSGASADHAFNVFTIDMIMDYESGGWDYIPNLQHLDTNGGLIVQKQFDHSPPAVGVIVNAASNPGPPDFGDITCYQISTTGFADPNTPGIQHNSFSTYGISGDFQFTRGAYGIQQLTNQVVEDPQMAYIQIGDFIREMPT